MSRFYSVCKTSLRLFTACIVFYSCNNNDSASQKKVVVEEKAAEGPSANTITDKHVAIPGSSIYIIPPEGYTVNSTTMQLSNESSNFMMMKMVRGYTPETYLKELQTDCEKNFPGSWQREEITNGKIKFAICYYKTAGIMQYYLVLTDPASNEMVVANFDENDTDTRLAMQAALKTAVIKQWLYTRYLHLHD